MRRDNNRHPKRTPLLAILSLSAWLFVMGCQLLSGVILNPTPAITPITRAELGITASNYPRMDGSTSTMPLASFIACELMQVPCVWTEWFDKTRMPLPNVTDFAGEFPGITHTGTHEAYVNLINAQADLILVARAPSDDELNLARDTGVVLDARPVALDAFVFVLNKESPINDLSIQEIQGIYTGKITDWEQLGGPAAPIQPYQREENSGSQELMQDLVMKNLKMIDAPDLVIPTMIGILYKVADDPNGIGYSVYFYEEFIAPNPQIKLIQIDGVLPDFENIRTRKYPLTAEVYVVIQAGAPPDSLAYKLRNWLLSGEGQQVVLKSGYVPLESAP